MDIALAMVVGLLLGGAGAWYALRRSDSRPAAELERTRAELGEAREKLARVEADHAARREELEKARGQLDTHFKGIASEVVQSSSQEFLKQARVQFEQHSELADKTLGERERAVRELVKPVREKLDSFDKHVRELETKRSGAYAQVNELIGQTQKQLDQLRSETGGLREALRSPQVRGLWGEQTLRNVLEASGMTEHVDFIEQDTLDTGERRLRPDVTVRIPGGKQIVIDAKTPLDAYLTAHETEDEAQRNQLLDRHADSLIAYARNLSSKDYAAELPSSFDFVVMFVPAETILDAATRVRPTLWQEAWNQHRVLIATPGLLIALIRTIAVGWQQEDIQKNVQEIADTALELYRRLGTYVQHIGRVGKSLDAAVDSYNKGVRSLETRLLPQARRIEDLGGAASAAKIEDLSQIEARVQPYSAPELIGSGAETETGEGASEDSGDGENERS